MIPCQKVSPLPPAYTQSTSMAQASKWYHRYTGCEIQDSQLYRHPLSALPWPNPLVIIFVLKKISALSLLNFKRLQKLGQGGNSPRLNERSTVSRRPLNYSYSSLHSLFHLARESLTLTVSKARLVLSFCLSLYITLYIIFFLTFFFFKTMQHTLSLNVLLHGPDESLNRLKWRFCLLEIGGWFLALCSSQALQGMNLEHRN